MKLAFIVCFLLLGITVNGNILYSSSNTKDAILHDALADWIGKWQTLAEMYLYDEDFRDAVMLTDEAYRDVNAFADDDPRGPPEEVYDKPFTCDPALGMSPSIPTSVHELRPGDIKVIGSLGDSITAGVGVGSNGMLGAAVENRGESWCIGGDFDLEQNITTLANVLKKFESDLKGASQCISEETQYRYAWFNQAGAGEMASDMWSSARRLIDLMKNDSRIDYVTDWKLITMLVGEHDLCQYCKNMNEHLPSTYVNHVTSALDLLQAEMPRAFVNLVPIYDVSPAHSVYYDVNGTEYEEEPRGDRRYPEACDDYRTTLCPCIVNETDRLPLKQVQLDYFNGLDNLVNTGRYDATPDFTVVLQPFFKDQTAHIDPITNLTDNRYYTPDCFHPNHRAHQIFAYSLWNTMLTPVGQKPLTASSALWPQYLCPSVESPYLFTRSNSVLS